MFLLGLIIGIIVGILIRSLFISSPSQEQHNIDYKYDYSDPDERNKKKRNRIYYPGINIKKEINSEYLTPNPDAEPNNPFYGKKIVFTGDLNNINRDDVAMYVSKLGGDVNTAISGKTDIVVVGENPGPSKMEKVAEINMSRQPMITIMDETEFLSVIEDHFVL